MAETQTKLSRERYDHLANRAQLFLEKQGGHCSEEALIAEVFGVRGKPEVWGGILRQALHDNSNFRRQPGGEWFLTSFTNEQHGLSELEYVVIDTETTGLNPRTNRITEIAAIKLKGGKRVATFETLLNPHRRLPSYITELTHITQDMVSSAPDFNKIIDKFLDFIQGCIVVGHNVAFDIRFLDGELQKLGRPPVLNETIDTIRLACRLNPGFRRPNLDRLAAMLNLPVTTRHRALADASLTADALLLLLCQAEKQGYLTLADLRSGRPSVAPTAIPSPQMEFKLELPDSNRFEMPSFDNYVEVAVVEAVEAETENATEEVVESPEEVVAEAENSERPARLRKPRRKGKRDIMLSLTDRATGRARHKLSRELIKDLPEKPGVYLMKNAEDKIIYVGKAKNLHNRVSSYYSEPLGYTRKIDGLTENIAKIDHIVTGSELEALLLESKLIKHYLPQYNRQLRNYENYPFIKIDLSQRFPRVYSVREIKDDGARYFGPFQSRRAVDTTIEIIEQLFSVRNCTRSFELDVLERQKKPKPHCLRFDLGRCPGPCIKGQATDEVHTTYMAIIDEVIDFLGGQKETMLDNLWQRMNKASANQDYEKARELRDAIQQVEKIVANQAFLAAAVEGNNLLIYLPSSQAGAIELLFVYQGRLGRQARLEIDNANLEDLVVKLASIWQELEQRELELNNQLQVPKRGGRVIRQEEVDEINIISRWVYSNSDNSAIIRVPDKMAAFGKGDFWQEAAEQILQSQVATQVEATWEQQSQF